MKVTARPHLTMKGHANNTITPHSISGNCSYPIPLIYHTSINNTKAEMKRVKLTGCIKLSRRQVHIMSMPELVNTNTNRDIKFGNWRWDN